jgi:hypothetical protein
MRLARALTPAFGHLSPWGREAPCDHLSNDWYKLLPYNSVLTLDRLRDELYGLSPRGREVAEGRSEGPILSLPSSHALHRPASSGFALSFSSGESGRGRGR